MITKYMSLSPRTYIIVDEILNSHAHNTIIYAKNVKESSCIVNIYHPRFNFPKLGNENNFIMQ